MDTKLDDITTESNLLNANSTHLKDCTEEEITDEDDLKATMYVLLLFYSCVFNVYKFYSISMFDFQRYKFDKNLTAIV